MAQQGIREYDAKCMRYEYSGSDYQGHLYHGSADSTYSKLQQFATELRSSTTQRRIVKPDQLFGKRGKNGLLGINLTTDEVITWIKEKNNTQVTIGKTTGTLHTFLVEPFVAHVSESEYYLSFETTRDTDRINFSTHGGVEIEEVWESVRSMEIELLEVTKASKAEEVVEASNAKESREAEYAEKYKVNDPLFSSLVDELPEDKKSLLISFIQQFTHFAQSYGLTYLEVNPLVVQDGQIHLLDMVAKIDTCEAHLQTSHWSGLERVKAFGSSPHPLEETIDALDAQTGASVQYRSLRPEGRIGLLLGGGGASVIVMDTLAQMGLIDEVINYGDLSGNPSYGDNKAYIQGLLQLMLSNDHPKQYLCYMGGIANFTKIDVFADAYIDALTPLIDQIKSKNIHMIIRRGGPGDTAGLAKIGDFLNMYDIPNHIADGDEYLTSVLDEIRLK